MVNEEATRVPEIGQCFQEGFWWSSVLVLLVRLKKHQCLGKREQISSPRARNIRGMNGRVEKRVNFSADGSSC